LAHLGKVRGYCVEEKSPGIYTVIGDIIPIQIIDSRKLSEEENIWLKDLDNELDVSRINRLTVEIEPPPRKRVLWQSGPDWGVCRRHSPCECGKDKGDVTDEWERINS
jgi:hypothetical protein